MHTFYLDAVPEVGAAATLPEDEAKHAMRVLRLGVGDEVCVLDGRGGRYAARIESPMGAVRVTEALPGNEPPVRVTLYQGLPKADKMEFIAQKLTELGVGGIVPVRMERCVVRSDEKDGEKRRERLDRIAREAAKQCRRACAPRVEPPMTWRQALTKLERHELTLAPWEDAAGLSMKEVCAQAPGAKDIAIVIGPEGGMSAGEVAALAEIGARIVTLGPRILRTETAAVVSAAMAMTLWGDL